MILSAHQPSYLPYLGFFHKIAASDVFVWLDDVQFEKRGFQNRNRIRTPKGWTWLTVPVLSKGRRFQTISEVELDDGKGWRSAHWEALRRSYGRSPGFERHAGFFESLYGRRWERLEPLCRELVDYLRGAFCIRTHFRRASEFSVEEASTARLVELCRRAKADAYLSGSGGRAYLEEAKFAQAGIGLQWQAFEEPRYRQMFPGFEPNMSAVDFLFNVESARAAAFFEGADR